MTMICLNADLFAQLALVDHVVAVGVDSIDRLLHHCCFPFHCHQSYC